MNQAEQDQNTDQHRRFKDKARELGADESDGALDKFMDRLHLKRSPDNEKEIPSPLQDKQDHRVGRRDDR